MHSRRYTCRNLHDNGIGQNGTAGMVIAEIGAPAGIDLDVVSDPDYGTCFELTATGGVLDGVVISALTEGGGSAVPTHGRATIYDRLLVKQTAGDSPALVESQITVLSAGGGGITGRICARSVETPLDEWIEVEGFDRADQLGRFTYPVYYFGLSGETTFRFVHQTEPNAWSDVPFFVADGLESRLVEPTALHGWSSAGNFATAGSDLTPTEAALLCRQLGGDFLRGGVPIWEYGSYDDQGDIPDLSVTPFEDAVLALRRAGVKLMMTMGQAVNFNGENGSLVALDDAAYGEDLADYWEEQITRYRHDLIAVEWFNEPNLNIFAGGEPDPAQYARLMRTLYRRLKPILGDKPFIAGALAAIANSSAGLMDVDDFVDGVYDELGGEKCCDAWSIHPYPQAARSGTTNSAYGFRAALDALRAAISRNGDDVPMWTTEQGYAKNLTISTAQPNLSAEARTQAAVDALMKGIASRRSDVDGVTTFALYGDAVPDWAHSHLPEKTPLPASSYAFSY